MFSKFSLFVFSALLLITTTGCGSKKPGQLVKTGKPVPAVFVQAGSTSICSHQDTVYFGNTPFTGHLFLLYKTGDTSFVKAYLNGVEEGVQKGWYPNRQLAEERFYISGKKEGLQRGWWPNGRLRFLFTATADVYNGELREWTSSGLLYLDFNYVNGHEEGSERLWWANGTVRANYVVRNGKRYGLLGMTVCEKPGAALVKK